MICPIEEPAATELEELRTKARSKQRITYDCFNAKTDGERVFCKFANLGRAKDGSFPLATVLTGRTATVCQACANYDVEEGE